VKGQRRRFYKFTRADVEINGVELIPDRDAIVLGDFGNGDMSGDSGVWEPPTTGYKVDRLERQRGHRNGGTAPKANASRINKDIGGERRRAA
jgi:hypothetical protein